VLCLRRGEMALHMLRVQSKEDTGGHSGSTTAAQQLGRTARGLLVVMASSSTCEHISLPFHRRSNEVHIGKPNGQAGGIN
jgi:hypothetical protein